MSTDPPSPPHHRFRQPQGEHRVHRSLADGNKFYTLENGSSSTTPVPPRRHQGFPFVQYREGADPKFAVKHFIFQRKETSLLAVGSDEYEERNNGKYTRRRTNVGQNCLEILVLPDRFLIRSSSSMSQLRGLAWSGVVWIHNGWSVGNSHERQVPTASYRLAIP